MSKTSSKTNKKYKRIEYRVCLLHNGVIVKNLLRSKDRTFIIFEFDKLVGKSKKVVFPKKHVNYKKIKPLKSEIVLLKSVGEDASNDRMFIDGWKWVKKEEFFEEETFKIFGFDGYYNISDLINVLSSRRTSSIREIGVLNNKLIIYNDECFDMAILPCMDDSVRLSKLIYEVMGFKKFFYKGPYIHGEKPDIVDLIVNETGWSRVKVNRRSNRP